MRANNLRLGAERLATRLQNGTHDIDGVQTHRMLMHLILYILIAFSFKVNIQVPKLLV